MSRVSVIIPLYHQKKLINRALDSIPKRNDVETIVIDDNSLDGSYYEVLRWKARHPGCNVRLLQNKENLGVGITVNRGYDEARGDYVVLLGSDDYLYTEEFVKAMQELDGTDLVYFDLRINDGFVWHLDEKTKHNYCGSTKFMRREFIGNTRNPEMRAREDYYFYQDLLKKKPTEKFTGIVAKHYNFPREGSLTWIACNGFK